MKIQFINQEEWGIELKPLEALARKTEAFIDVYPGTINVVFVNDKYIQALNRQYRQKDQPTDVLSFNYLEGGVSDADALVGEVYISVETTRRQAEAQKETFADELNKLFVHGLLHIHGYDHELDADYIKMHEKECEILGRDLPLYLEEK